MNSLTIAAFLGTVSLRQTTIDSIANSNQQEHLKVGVGMINTCYTGINRLKEGPDDWESIIGSGESYSDTEFKGTRTLFQFPFTGYFSWFQYYARYYEGTLTWDRMAEHYKSEGVDVSLFGDQPDFLDINGWHNPDNSYIQAAFGALSEFPDKARAIFLTDELNNEGIYAVKFYIRGKPWIVTVDDEILMFNAGKSWFSDYTSTKYTNYGQIGDDGSIWGAILEKAWAKVKGSYLSSEDGILSNGLRALTGAPVFMYSIWGESMYAINKHEEWVTWAEMEAGQDTQYYVAEDVWDMITASDDLEYLMGAYTQGRRWLNNYWLQNNKAYTIIDAFQLTDTNGNVEYNMYMLRDSWSSTWYESDFSASQYDHDSHESSVNDFWTDQYIAQVPHNINPTESNEDGIFIVEESDFLDIFQYITIAHYRDDDGYSGNWYDVDGIGEHENEFSVTVPEKSGDLYFTAESYYLGMMPDMCTWWELNTILMWITQNDEIISTAEYDEWTNYPMFISEDEYEAGDEFKIMIAIDWAGLSKVEFTVKVYSSQDLEVKNRWGETNEIHMDGTSPSGFTKSDYSV